MKTKRLTAFVIALCIMYTLLPIKATAITSKSIYAVSYGHGVVSADTYSAGTGTTVTVTLQPDANRQHMGIGDTSVDPGPDFVMQKQMEADMKYVSASPSGAVNDINSALGEYTTGTTIDSDNYSGAPSYYPINFIFAITNDDNATPITLTKVDDTTYTFTMPDAPVKVVAGFGSVTTEPSDARSPIDSSISQIQMGNPVTHSSYLDFAVEMCLDLKCLYNPYYIENVFDFSNGTVLQITYPAEGASSTYGSTLLNALDVARDYNGTKQISLGETNFILPEGITDTQKNQKMFSVTGDGNGNFSVSCLLSSNSIVTSPYYTVINGHEIRSAQTDSYVYSPSSLFVGDIDDPQYTKIVSGYYYVNRLTTLTAKKWGISFAFKYGTPDKVSIGGTNIVNGDNVTYWVNDDVTGGIKSDGASASSYNAKYEPDTHTLTLNGLNVDGSFNNTALYANCELNIVLNDSNNVINNYSELNKHSFGISVLGSLSFSGSGSLNAKAGDGTGNYSLGIFGADNININLTGGTINAYGRNAKNSSYGIFIYDSFSRNAGNLTLTSGTLNAYGGNTSDNDYESIGIYVDNKLTATGGTITSTGGTVSGTNADSYGIFAETAEISTAVTAIGGTSQFVSSGIESYHLLIKDGAANALNFGIVYNSYDCIA